MDQSLYRKLEQEIIEMLRTKIPSDVPYHNVEHTKDVCAAAERLGRLESVNEHDLLLLKTAALFHDTGYVVARSEHEERSCEIARERLSAENVLADEIEQVCKLILATRVPQRPATHLEEILCDADLDYLGRDDFQEISDKVFAEFQTFGVVHDRQEWQQLQVKFFETHHYFTPSAIRLRQQKKEENLSVIRNTLTV